VDDGAGLGLGEAVSKWRSEATRRGISKHEIDRMASAFEQEDLRESLNP
jgi:hypothetical protein